jgi:hypothetical protein
MTDLVRGGSSNQFMRELRLVGGVDDLRFSRSDQMYTV